MKTQYLSESRGTTRTSWLESRHSFSFGGFQDPARTGFGPLLVINEDWIQPGSGFPRHPHSDMEILTYVVSGTLEHQDGLGNIERIGAGQAQAMSAGTGILHSEKNASEDELLHLLQIWIQPERAGLEPSWEFPDGAAMQDGSALHLLASRDRREGAAKIHQDARLHVGRIPSGGSTRHDLQADRRAWLQLIRGGLVLDGMELSPGDGLALEAETELSLEATEASEYLLFDLP